MFYVYILKSRLYGSYYVGSCKNLDKRARQHNLGLVKSTRRDMPWGVVYQETLVNLGEARKRELQIKSWKKRVAIESLIKTFQN